MSERLYIVMSFHSWDSLTSRWVNPQVEGTAATGFLPVFESREEAEAEYPQNNIVEAERPARERMR